jgi:hypothetical protein
MMNRCPWTRLIPLVLLIAPWLAVSCGDEGGGPGRGGIAEPCEADGDCFEGLICHRGACASCPIPCGSSCCVVGEEECADDTCVAICQGSRCGEQCCERGEMCLDDGCCTARLTCAGACCEEGQQCDVDRGCVTCTTLLCDGECCPRGTQCLDGTCCPDDRRCAGLCCDVGQVCIDNSCQIDCGDAPRCGDSCCALGEVCTLGGCLVPGSLCDSHLDCDEEQYCDPALGRCLPLAETSDECEHRPPVGEFEPEVEWHWEGYSLNPSFRQVLSTPLVGDVDGDGLPEVVVLAFAGGDLHSAIAVVLNGEDGSELWVLDDPAVRFDGTAHGALADVDGDGTAEIALPRAEGGMSLLDHDGTVLWTFDAGTASTALYAGAIAVGDIDQDGSADFVFGGAVVSAAGALVADHGPLGSNWDTRDGRRSYMPSLYDISGDSVLDFIAGGSARSGLDGTVLWSDETVGDGFTALGDLEVDGEVEVVVVADGEVHVLSGLEGDLLHTWPLPEPEAGECLDENRGGPPTVADFDLDGRPEIGVAGCGAYTVFDADCTPTGDFAFCPPARVDGVLWTAATQDHSSSATGSSVFDFEGDGAAEAVYNDECFLRIYEGATGRVLFQTANSSRTGTEYPVIADVDGDGNAEIVVSANDDQVVRDGCEAGTHGVYVYGDRLRNWVRTLPIWNEHTYHVTNVAPDGTVEAHELPNYMTTGLNNFRQNVQTEGIFNTSNLVPEDLDADIFYCPDRYLLRVRVVNRGSAGVNAGVTVGFYRGEPTGDHELLGLALTERPLLPGTSELVVLSWEPAGDVVTELTWFAVADDVEAGGVEVAVHECDETDNTSEPEHVVCSAVE